MPPYKVLEVEGPREWEWDGQVNHDYTLTLDGEAMQAILTQKPKTPSPRMGDVMDLELTPHKKFDNKLKAKRARQFNGVGGGGKSPEESARIMRQHSQEMALRYAAIKAQLGTLPGDFKPDTLRPIIDWFHEDAKAAKP